jgi:hypothetical protein
MSTTRHYACHQAADLLSDLSLPVIIFGWFLGFDENGTEQAQPHLAIPVARSCSSSWLLASQRAPLLLRSRDAQPLRLCDFLSRTD